MTFGDGTLIRAAADALGTVVGAVLAPVTGLSESTGRTIEGLGGSVGEAVEDVGGGVGGLFDSLGDVFPLLIMVGGGVLVIFLIVKL